MEEALIEMEKGRTLRGADVIEPIRIEALVALFSGDFVAARVHLDEVSRLSQAIGDTYLALAYYYSGNGGRGRAMLESLSTHASASTATRSGAALAGVLAAQGNLPLPVCTLTMSWLAITATITSHTASVRRMPSSVRSIKPFDGCGRPPTPAFRASRGSSATRCSSPCVVARSSQSCRRMCGQTRA
jgi:hypothetical protein